MGATTGLFHAVAIVMLISGASKWRDPAPFTSTWLALWGRPPRGTARAVGAVEVVLGLAALSGRSGGALALVVAAAYVVFAVVVGLAIRRGVPSCGCFGRRAAPPARVHVVTNLASALVAMIVGGTALRAGDDVAAVWAPLRGGGWTGVTEVVLVAMCAGLVIALDTDGAALAHEVRVARAAR